LDRLFFCWEIFVSAIPVIFKEKKLLIFQVVPALYLSVQLFSLNGFCLTAHNNFFEVVSTNHFNEFISYLIAIFLYSFFNVAYCYEIRYAFRNRRTSIIRGLAYALFKFPAILYWSILSATIGIISSLVRKDNILGEIVSNIIDLIWSATSCFYIAVLASDDKITNPFAIYEKTLSAFASRWKDLVVQNVGIHLLLILPVVFYISLLFSNWNVLNNAKITNIFISSPLSLTIATISLILFGTFIEIANNIFLLEVYDYAVDDVTNKYSKSQIEKALSIA
jgi:hypothetical protein